MAYGDLLHIPNETALNQSSSRWKRLPLGETAGRSEAWLRDTLHANPDILPVSDIDPAFTPLWPLCTAINERWSDRQCLHQSDRPIDASRVQTVAKPRVTPKSCRPDS